MSFELNDEERGIAEGVIAAIAPDELPLLKQLMIRPRWRDQLQGNSVGYGVDSALPVIAPYVLVVVVWAKSVIGDEAKKVMDKRLRALTRRVLLDNEPGRSSPPPVPASTNPNELRKAVASYAVTLGLRADRASLLADAVVGRMLPGGER